MSFSALCSVPLLTVWHLCQRRECNYEVSHSAYGDVAFDGGLCFVGEALACLAAGGVAGDGVWDGGVGGGHGWIEVLGLFLGVDVGCWFKWWGCVVMSGRVEAEGNEEGEFRHDVNRIYIR